MGLYTMKNVVQASNEVEDNLQEAMTKTSENMKESLRQDIQSIKTVRSFFEDCKSIIEGQDYEIVFKSSNKKFYILKTKTADGVWFNYQEARMITDKKIRGPQETIKSVKSWFAEDEERFEDVYMYLYSRYRKRCTYYVCECLIEYLEYLREQENE